MYVPWQLEKLKRWCFTGTPHDGSMQKAPFHYDVDRKAFAPISVTSDHAKLLTYKELLPLLEANPDRGFGFVLTEGDGYTCMDIDIGDHTPVSHTMKWWNLVQDYQTYTEASRSGCGYHLWFAGEVKGAYKRHGMEIYSKERFIICTGNTILEYDLNSDPQHIMDMNAFISESRKVDSVGDIDRPQVRSDEDIINDAYSSDHSGKFKCLMEGDWDTYVGIMHQQGSRDYVWDPSQADCAFMTIITFYTRNIEQCKRIWRECALANIQKRYPGDRRMQSQKNARNGGDYKMHKAIQYGVTKNDRDKAVNDALSEDGGKQAKQLRGSRSKSEADPANAEPVLELPPLTHTELSYPPGKMGELARHFYTASNKQVKEFAILEALAMCSGIFGRVYNVSKTGLNNYFMVLATSGTGKSELTSNPQKFMRYLERNEGIIDASRFIHGQEFTHRNSMMQFFRDNTSFVHVMSEFGHHFRAMVKGDGSNKTVREIMTDVYSKSGFQDFVGGVRYTDSEKTVNIDHSIAYSFLGECVPETFFDCLDRETFSDGFVSRFIFTEYNGPIPYDNPNYGEPPRELVEHMTSAVLGVSAALRDPSNPEVMHVGYTPEVGKALKNFSTYCTDQQNKAKDDIIWNALWARCNLKVLKISALLAVMDRPSNPAITNEHMMWAWQFIHQHNHLVWSSVIQGRISGDSSSTERSEHLGTLMCKLIDTPYAELSSEVRRRVKPILHEDCIIPRSVLARHCARVNMFKDAGYRTTDDLITAALRNLDSAGTIRIVNKREMAEKYNARTEGYQYIGN